MKRTKSQEPADPLVRAEIEEHFRTKLNMTVLGANAMAAAILEVYCRHLVSGKTIEMRTVGKIESRYRSARRHHMVAETPETRGTGSRMKMTPVRRVLRFSPSQKLRARMLEHYHKNHPGEE